MLRRLVIHRYRSALAYCPSPPLPLHTVYYPKVAAEYAPVFFVPGMYGYFPPEMYSDTLTQLAGRGYIVLAVSPVIPTSDARDSPVTHASSIRLAGEVDKMIKTLEWVSGRRESVFVCSCIVLCVRANCKVVVGCCCYTLQLTAVFYLPLHTLSITS